MKKQSVKTNYLFNAGYQLFALLVPLITTPYISRILGADGIGIHSYTYSIVRYFWLFSLLGISTYGVRKIGIYQDDIAKRSKTFWEIVLLKIILSSISIFLYSLYILFFSTNKVIAIIQGIYLIAVCLDISFFFQGMENFKKISIRNFIVKLINIIFIFVFIKDGNDLWKYVFGLSFFYLVGNLIMWFSLKGNIIKVSIKELKPFKDFNVILALFFPTIASQLYAVIDKSMIGWITDSFAENGYYEQSLKIIEMSLMLITTLSSVMLPKVARAYKENKTDEVQENMYKAYSFVWLLGFPMLFGILGISNILVPIFFGEGYDKVITILPIMSILFIFMGINFATGTLYLVSTNQQKVYNNHLLISGIVNVLLNFVFIYYLQSIGASIATVIGELVLLMLNLGFIYKTKQFNVYKIISLSKKYLISGLIMFICILVMKLFIPSNLIGLISIILFSMMIYAICLIILKEEMVFEYINEFKKKLKKN